MKDLKVAIIGSCVTRDFVSLCDFERSNIFYTARTSFISLNSSPIDFSPDDVKVEHAFNKRVVCSDLSKEFLVSLKENKPDILLLDFIDERFDIIDVQGKYCTRSQYLEMSGLLEKFQDYKVIKREAAHELWMDSCEKICNELKGLTDNIILHKALWATKYRNHDSNELLDFDVKETEMAQKNNNYLERYFEKFLSCVPSAKVLEPNMDLVYSDYAHKWGRDFFHFGKEYNDDILNKFKNLCDL